MWDLVCYTEVTIGCFVTQSDTCLYCRILLCLLGVGGFLFIWISFLNISVTFFSGFNGNNLLYPQTTYLKFRYMSVSDVDRSLHVSKRNQHCRQWTITTWDLLRVYVFLREFTPVDFCFIVPVIPRIIL